MESSVFNSPIFYSGSVEDDEVDQQISILQPSERTKPTRVLHRAQAVLFFCVPVILSLVLLFTFRLWKPVMGLMMHKIWAVMRFLLVTAGIGLGIMNSKLWNDGYARQDDLDSVAGKEGSMSPKAAPFMSFFYSEWRPSYLHEDKDLTGSADESIVDKFSTSTTDIVSESALPAAAFHNDDGKSSEAGNNTIVNRDSNYSSPSSEIAHRVQSEATPDEDGKTANEKVLSRESLKSTRAVTMSRSAQSCDDLGLANVLENEQTNPGKKIIHRRGKSLEFPTTEAGGHIPRKATLFPSVGEMPSSESATHPSARPVSKHSKKRTDECTQSFDADIDLKPASRSTQRGTRHRRSQSAYDLGELADEQRGRKPEKAHRHSRRRNASLSFAVAEDFTGGLPSWMVPPPSPPPPFMGPSTDAVDANKNDLIGDRIEGMEDESSLRRAYRESLAPWRTAAKSSPITIAEKDMAMKEVKPLVQNDGEQTPPSSPGSFRELVSSGEFNRKVESFIARFHERMRLQRLESLERARRRPAS
ncbi:hypothetical protein KP509_16G070400 [Ceratopteris richardii]|uniref:Uncharacterized protein n=2 Tax=Ceratopteris richardii TaxID=49495 RepID=A0A8T2SZQ9_CERRI|nr:hypothetical protein KP509_16G070400 [Ceratopteris richardii]